MNRKIPNASVHHIAFAVSAFDKSKKFYTEGLGFTVHAEWLEGEDTRACLLDIGNGSCFELFSNGSSAPQQNEKVVHVALSTSDPDAAYNAALAAGATTHMEPTDLTIPSSPAMPVRIAFVKGLDGELLEFFKAR